MGKIFKKPLLFVKKSESKKGKLWNELADKRAKEQHGNIDELPEDDIHAVKRFIVPDLYPKADPEETEDAVSSLKGEIQKLKIKDERSFSPERTQVDDDKDANR
jgi:hypothetical protein